MMNFRNIQAVTGGEWLVAPSQQETPLVGGAFDTRSLGAAEIFFAWKGAHSDGHRHVGQLAGSTVRLMIVERAVEPVEGIVVLKVDDSLKALHRIAGGLSRGFGGKIISLTGSSGKTTAKTWLCHVLHGRYNLLSNPGSFNNHIGCPITLLSLRPDHELVVLEMGTSGAGELSLLSAIAPADITILLNVGHAHLGRFGRLEDTYQAKLEIFSHQRPQALSLIPFSDERLRHQFHRRRVEYFGENAPRFGWRCESVDPRRMRQMLRFQTPEGEKQVSVGHIGSFVGESLSAVIAVAFHLGLTWSDIEPRLEDLPMEKGRSQFTRGLNEVLLLDDTYNANPESVISMLKTIGRLQMGRTIGVIGNLAELDEDLKDSARTILDNLPASHLSHLFLSGESGRILQPIIAERHPPLSITYIQDIRELIERLRSFCQPGTVIGVKGSRSAHMERVIYALKGSLSDCWWDPCGRLNMCLHCDRFRAGRDSPV